MPFTQNEDDSARVSPASRSVVDVCPVMEQRVGGQQTTTTRREVSILMSVGLKKKPKSKYMYTIIMWSAWVHVHMFGPVFQLKGLRQD